MSDGYTEGTQPFDLLRSRIATLFRLGPGGDLQAVNEADAPPAPAFFATFGASESVFRFGSAYPDERRPRVAALLDRWDESGVTRRWAKSEIPDEERTRIRLELGIEPDATEWHGAVFAFPEALERSDGGPTVQLFDPEALPSGILVGDAGIRGIQPCFAVLRGRSAISVCHTARRGPKVLEAGVETRPAFRRRHHAFMVCTAWAHAVRAEGGIPVYSASLDNEPSLRLARSLGLLRIGTDLHYSL